MTLDPSQQPQPQPYQPPASSPAPSPVNVPSFIPASVALAPKKGSGGRVATGTIVLVLAGFVAAAGIGFAGGRATAPASTNTRQFNNGVAGFPNASGVPGGAGAFRGIGGGTDVTGSVTAVGSGSITIKTTDGQSVTITVPATATYHGQTAATAADVAVGSQVKVTINRAGFGRPDASGAPAASPGTATITITATDITLVGK